jgi:hypothetical protein
MYNADQISIQDQKAKENYETMMRLEDEKAKENYETMVSIQHGLQ